MLGLSAWSGLPAKITCFAVKSCLRGPEIGGLLMLVESELVLAIG